MAHGLLDRRGQRLLRAPMNLRPAAKEVGQRRAASDKQRQHPQRPRPVQAADQHLARGHDGELPHRAARAGDTHGRTAVGGRHRTGHDGQDHGEGRARLAQADQHAGGQVERGFIRGEPRADHAQHIQHRAQGNGAARAIAVCQDAHEDTGHTPHQVLQREGHGKHLAAPALGQAHRLHEQAESGAYPHGEQHDQRAKRNGAH
ncbi:hypothetical protein D9M68_620970 [compost metagenome]